MTYYGSQMVVEHYNMMGPVKAALEAATRYMAAELGPKGIRVHAISPGPLKTRAASGISEFDQLLEKAQEKAPARSLVSIDDVGIAVAFLATDAAQADHGRNALHRWRLPHHGLTGKPSRAHTRRSCSLTIAARPCLLRGACSRPRGSRCTPTAPIPAAPCARPRPARGAALRLGASQARPRQPAVHRPARPLRHHPMRASTPRARCSTAVEAVRVESVVTVTGKVVNRAGGDREPASSPPARSSCRSTTFVVQSAAEVLPLQVASDEDSREDIRLRYRFLDLRREKLHRNIVLRSQVIAEHPPAHDRAGLHRVPDADPDLELARGRARLPGAEPAASRQVLRAAAGAAAVQAAADGRGLRPLLPDRALLPRRGQPRRPQPRRVLPARFRDVVRDPGGRVRGHRAGAARRVRGVRRRPRR